MANEAASQAAAVVGQAAPETVSDVAAEVGKVASEAGQTAAQIGQKAVENAPMPPLPLADTGHTVLITLGYLCLLLGIIFFAYWLMKKLGFHGMGVHAGKNAPQLMSRLMLGNRQSVAVVRYREKDMVIGVTENNINLIREFEAEDSEPESGERRSFASLLKRTGTNDE